VGVSSPKIVFVMKYSDGTAYKPIHGSAICRYKTGDEIFEFSCDIEWNVEGDSDCDSLEEAVEVANCMSIEPIAWNNKKSSKINSQMWISYLTDHQ
jgi:hypothetical protein